MPVVSATANAHTADEAFTQTVLTDRAKRSEQLRISCNKTRLALGEALFVGARAVFIHSDKEQICAGKCQLILKLFAG